MEHKGSGSIFYKPDVELVCKKGLEWIAKKRANAREECIDNWMNGRGTFLNNYPKILKLLGYPKSREWAIERADCPHFNDHGWMFETTKQKLIELLAMAETYKYEKSSVEYYMFISVEDFHIISPIWKETFEVKKDDV